MNDGRIVSSHIIPMSKTNSQLLYSQNDGATVEITVNSEEALVIAKRWEWDNQREKNLL